ncbi:hypothetical protein [Gloeocapsa sp. PCC 7428]|uniref:hypothetical protein n=1 Tax=Gloeocapsa sp. PCC 7428 TaxID=1173026 RepID=UPI001E4B59B6|nr:hypothetical protein [Gloeocapsa sp. PCC 7428]
MDENVTPAYVTQIPGIFLLNPSLSIGENIDELILIAEGSFDDEYQDQIIHLPMT